MNEVKPDAASSGQSKLKKVFNAYTLSIVLAAAVFFIFGFALEKYLANKQTSARSAIYEVRAGAYNKTSIHFTNPLLTCETSYSAEAAEFKSLKSQLKKLIDGKVGSGDAQTVSVYFDTRDGRWLTINPSDEYYPASLFKVPLMMSIFNIASTNPDYLSRKLLYTGKDDLTKQQNFKPAQTLRAGQYYTVDELVRRMIVYSDNNATALLYSSDSSTLLKNTEQDLGFTPDNGKVKVKDYANFFRVLYNTTYLDRLASEKALALLSKPDFLQGIRSGLPSSVEVAQKFGEQNIVDNNKSLFKELHDCGIIYHPNHHYLLCVMTKGDDFSKLATIIRDISALVYNNISSL